MQKTLLINTDAYSALLAEKSRSVKATGKSPTYSEIILDLLEDRK